MLNMTKEEKEYLRENLSEFIGYLVFRNKPVDCKTIFVKKTYERPLDEHVLIIGSYNNYLETMCPFETDNMSNDTDLKFSNLELDKEYTLEELIEMEELE